MSYTLRSPPTLIALTLAASMGLASCESIERQTGLGKETQMGAGAGAAAGGIIAALANANPAWIAASTILGGVTGGFIGKYLSRDDAEKHASNQYNSVRNLKAGETSRWSNPQTGHSGYTTVKRVYNGSLGRECKDFVEVIETPQRTFRENGTVCQDANGNWTI